MRTRRDRALALWGRYYLELEELALEVCTGRLTRGQPWPATHAQHVAMSRANLRGLLELARRAHTLGLSPELLEAGRREAQALSLSQLRTLRKCGALEHN